MAHLDSVALINAIADLSDLLARKGNTDTFLHDLVHLIAGYTEAQVCSIYLYDEEAKLLVLRATAGLNAEFVGRIHLRPGEGLTGFAFQQNRPVFEREAGASDKNVAFPGFGEERYPAFAGVPIRRNNAGIGVLILQDSDPEKFDEHTIRTLRAIGSHLAVILENAAVLYELHTDFDRPLPEETDDYVTSGQIIATASASQGFGIGRIEFLDLSTDTAQGTITCTIDKAIEKSYTQLQNLGSQIDPSLSDVASLIFSSHLLMLRDDSFSGAMIKLVETGTDPVEAVQDVVDSFAAIFSSFEEERFQEKVQDVRDLGRRILRNLTGQDEDELDYRGRIVVATEIFPSELVKLFIQRAEGIVFPDGGATAHIAILAQSLQFPAIANSDPRLYAVPQGTLVVLDGEDGRIVINPNEDICESYRRRAIEQQQIDKEPPIQRPTQTLCGTNITLYANVNLVKDALSAHSAGAHGIGLYRSEIPFLIRNGFPTEEEQIAVYTRVISALPGKPVHFRTLDIGGDKLLSEQVGDEPNPFLGFRGIRFLLAHSDIFQEQLRAMLRAGYGREIGIQFPMIASLDELRAAKREVELSLSSLKREGVKYNATPRIGVMVEIPATVEILPELEKEVDFMSIGTNDLTMYLLAADRANARVANIYSPLHPSVLRTLKRIVSTVDTKRTELSVCGTSAEDPAIAVFLLALGLRTFSVSPHHIRSLNRMLCGISVDKAQEYADSLLSAATLFETHEIAGKIRAELSAS